MLAAPQIKHENTLKFLNILRVLYYLPNLAAFKSATSAINQHFIQYISGCFSHTFHYHYYWYNPLRVAYLHITIGL